MAQCSHCSAPLPKSGIICQYCGTRNDIDLKATKKFVNLRPDLDRECPICHIQLQTINVGEKSDFFIERCESCYGIFFDVSELEEMIERSVEGSRNIDLEKLAQITQNPRYVDILNYRKCPVCKKTMHRKNFMRRSGVITDVCYEHGVWLDSGELRQILEWIKVGGEQKIKEAASMQSNFSQIKDRSKDSRLSEQESREPELFESILEYFFRPRWL